MTDQKFMIELGEDQRAIVDPDDSGWLRDKLRQEPGSTRVTMRSDEDDTEGHGAHAGVLVRVIAEDEDDTEGHAISIHFPSREDADAFRKRLLVTGVLAGTIALGAAGGVGLANLTSEDASAGAAQTTVTGSDWSQAERPPAIAPAVGGSDWSQMERPAAASADGSGSAWTQDERPGTATTGTTSSDDAGAGAAQTTVTGSDWSQAERPPAIAPAVGGSDWSQMERPAAASTDGSGSAWTQDERPGSATTGTTSSDDDSAAGEAPFRGGPTPE